MYEHITHPLLVTSTGVGVIPSILTAHHGRRTSQPSTCAKRRPYHPARQQGHCPLNSSVRPEDRVAFACWQMGDPRQASLGPPLNPGPFYRVYWEWTASGHSRNNRLLVEALLCHYGEFDTLKNPYPSSIQDHAAGGGDGSIMVGMFVSLCLVFS